MSTEVGVGTSECVCECLDNLFCALHSHTASVYLYRCVPVSVCVCACLRSRFAFDSWGVVGISWELFVNIRSHKFYFIVALFYGIIPRWLPKLAVFFLPPTALAHISRPFSSRSAMTQVFLASVSKQTPDSGLGRAVPANQPESPALFIRRQTVQNELFKMVAGGFFFLVCTSSVTLWVSTPIFLFN